MNLLTGLFRSSVGKKFIMAVTGGALFLFVIGHLLGNLQIFLDPTAINAYGHLLQSNLEIIWPARIGLIVAVGLHIWAGITLSAANQAARPVAYAQPKPNTASMASRTMLMSGLIIATFIVYHLLHYTVLVQAINFTGVDFATLKEPKTGYHDVYAMMIYGFNQPLVAMFYAVAMLLLCLHLSHGIGAMFQSLGWRNAAYGALLDAFAKFAALAIFVGYTSIPVAVMLGHGKEYLNEVMKTAPALHAVGKEVTK